MEWRFSDDFQMPWYNNFIRGIRRIPKQKHRIGGIPQNIISYGIPSNSLDISNLLIA